MEEDAIRNYWLPKGDGYWRKWKTQEDWQEAPKTIQCVNYKKEMETRKIAVKEGTNIIRWGKRIKRMFTIDKGYYIKVGSTSNPETKKRDIIWKMKTWPR